MAPFHSHGLHGNSWCLILHPAKPLPFSRALRERAPSLLLRAEAEQPLQVRCSLPRVFPAGVKRLLKRAVVLGGSGFSWEYSTVHVHTGWRERPPIAISTLLDSAVDGGTQKPWQPGKKMVVGRPERTELVFPAQAKQLLVGSRAVLAVDR